MTGRIVRHYLKPWLRLYVRGKLLGDPIFHAASDLLAGSDLPVLDVGCGIGLFEFYLRERGYSAPLQGIDFDRKKIELARRVAARSYCEIDFQVGDVLEAAPFQGHVLIFDVLHYLDEAKQIELLANVAALVAPGGMCLMRATPRDESWRFRVTRWEEFFLRASLWMKSGAVHYLTIEQMLAPFLSAGFETEVRPLWGKTPFNSYLFVLRRPGIEA